MLVLVAYFVVARRKAKPVLYHWANVVLGGPIVLASALRGAWPAAFGALSFTLIGALGVVTYLTAVVEDRSRRARASADVWVHCLRPDCSWRERVASPVDGPPLLRAHTLRDHDETGTGGGIVTSDEDWVTRPE